MGKPRATRVQTVRIFSRCLKIVGRISEPAQKKRGQKVSLVLGEQMRQDARVARGQSWQLFSLVLGEKMRTVATGKNPDRLICPDRQGQGCRNGLTVFLQRRHRLPEHSTRRKIDNAAPYAPAVHRLSCRSAAAMRPRRTARLCRALHGGSPLRFSILSGQGETLSNLGPVSLPSFQLWTCMFSASSCVRLMRLPPRRWQ